MFRNFSEEAVIYDLNFEEFSSNYQSEINRSFAPMIPQDSSKENKERIRYSLEKFERRYVRK